MKKLLLLLGFLILITSLAEAQSDKTWIDLDGSNDFLDFGTDNILAGKSQFTVEMRVHFDSNSGDFTLIGQRNADNNRTIVLQRWAGAFYLFLSNGNWGTCSFIPCLTNIYHRAIVYDGNGLSNDTRLKLYINGVLQTLTYNGTIDLISYTTSPAANLVLGCEHNGPSTQLQFLNGQFGEWCVWNYPLTAAEINNRVVPEVSGSENGLLEYFHFNNGIPNGNNTTITSFAGGKGICTITTVNLAMNGSSSNFTGGPVSVTVDDNVITSNLNGASYQWLDCNNNFAIIPGATAQSYTATPGSYAVHVSDGFCSDTSDCTLIIPSAVPDLQLQQFIIYPNPVADELIIENKTNKEKLFFEILTTTGQVVFYGDMMETTVVQVSDFAAGIYFIKITGDNFNEWRKVVKD
ncbi:MAG: T9SS type A sorting domain-containing protein [Chitinophagales bacterium]